MRYHLSSLRTFPAVAVVTSLPFKSQQLVFSRPFSSNRSRKSERPVTNLASDLQNDQNALHGITSIERGAQWPRSEEASPTAEALLVETEASPLETEALSMESDASWIETEASSTETEVEAETTSLETTDYVPWYLRVQTQATSTQSSNPLADKQKIPDLPEYPPPILSNTLEHLSMNIGLDYLTLLDLRNLDPPAALGSNLMMIVGTARSEKHLHVSADRFCRWLRTEKKMNPYADGLLGRNELKLKMRRKNRRAKLMANVGAPAAENVDDGIRTGWVCVIAGRVDPAADSPIKKLEEIEGFVGFGEVSNEVTLVVQMFTEEKRAETDLEGLWKNLRERNERKAKHRDDEIAEAEILAEKMLDESSTDRQDQSPYIEDALGAHFRELDSQNTIDHDRGLRHTSTG